MQQTNDRLLQILSDTVKANLLAEDRVNKRLAGLVAEGQRLSQEGQRLSMASRASQGSQRESGLGTDSPPGGSRGGSRGTSEIEDLKVSLGRPCPQLISTPLSDIY